MPRTAASIPHPVPWVMFAAPIVIGVIVAEDTG
jgi:hypothetical protein